MKNLNRRDFLKYTGMGATAFAVHPCLDNLKKFANNTFSDKPNIIFIMSDDHASNAVSSYGGILAKAAKTPNIDRLADEGVRFTNSFCTNSICAPSRAVLLTGKYSHINGQLDNRGTFDGNQETFPKLLQRTGYQTAMIGKWHLKSDPTGFDYWNILPGQGDYYNPVFIEMGNRKNYKGYVTNLITDFSLDWIKNRNNENPFCLLLHHKAPHRNWMPDIKHLSMYDNVDIPVPETFYDDYKTRSDAARQQEMTIAKHMNLSWDLKLTPEDRVNLTGLERSWVQKLNRLDEEQLNAWNASYEPKNRAFRQADLKGDELIEWKYQRYIKDYLRCIASVDDNVGRVLDYLDDSGLTENTIVVYTSDQGFFLGEHGWFDKRFMYEESLRMPLLIRYPGGIKKGMVNNDMALNLDFASTFLDYAGTAIPDDIQGSSLRPLLEGKTPENWRKSMYYHYYEFPGSHSVKKHYGIRTTRYKLMHFYDNIDAWELYDLQNDPHELNNLYENDDYAELIIRLKDELQKLRIKFGEIE